MAAKKEPFNHRRRCEINSGKVSGTSVVPTALFTYFSNLGGLNQLSIAKIQRVEHQLDLCFATTSKQSMRYERIQSDLGIINDAADGQVTHIFCQIHV